MPRYSSRVVSSRQISPTAWELTFERCGLSLHAGQLVRLHDRAGLHHRSYTVASGEHDEHLQILYRHIPDGHLTPELVKLSPGDPLEVSGPFGEFVLRDRSRPLVFVATGTGLAPCLAYTRTYRDLNLTLLHGVRTVSDLFYREWFDGPRYHPCVSRENGAGFHGRVTALLPTLTFAPDTHFYLCGANAMIFEAQSLLESLGFTSDAVFNEAYYSGF